MDRTRLFKALAKREAEHPKVEEPEKPEKVEEPVKEGFFKRIFKWNKKSSE